MSQLSIITTGLSSDLVDWLGTYAKKRKVTRRSILEEAVKDYRFRARRKEFEESFKRAAKDPEMQEFAEMGMEDYEDQLKRMAI